MTKKELFEAMSGLPDDTEVTFHDQDENEMELCKDLTNCTSFEFEGCTKTFLALGLAPASGKRGKPLGRIQADGIDGLIFDK